MNKYDYFYDESDLGNYPPKPEVQNAPKGLVNISLNFVFYILIYLFLFQGDLKLLSAVLMVMFVHEFGHFFWMRKFNYKESRLFFIPFMNLFISSTSNEQITLKEKLFLLFSGPIPGIFFGIIMLYFGNKNSHESLIQLGWIFLVWNLINLIPLDTLDGGALAECLSNVNDYTIKLITTIVTTCLVVVYALLSKSFLTLIIPVFLLMRLRSLKHLHEIRYKLDNKGINWRTSFLLLNNKQYWMLRKEMSDEIEPNIFANSDSSITKEILNTFVNRQIKSVLLNGPYIDISKRGITLTIVFWLLAFIGPLFFIFLLI